MHKWPWKVPENAQEGLECHWKLLRVFRRHPD